MSEKGTISRIKVNNAAESAMFEKSSLWKDKSCTNSGNGHLVRQSPKGTKYAVWNLSIGVSLGKWLTTCQNELDNVVNATESCRITLFTKGSSNSKQTDNEVFTTECLHVYCLWCEVVSPLYNLTMNKHLLEIWYSKVGFRFGDGQRFDSL